MSVGRYVPPTFDMQAFHCPHCGTYAHQLWHYVLRMSGGASQGVENARISLCAHCGKYAVWVDGQMVYPGASPAPLPSADMPVDVRADFVEAREVVATSPRSAAALLRLALQKLMPHLGEKGKDLNDDIGSLVSKGLPTKIQQALDALRVIGNNAVHPGQIDLKDDQATATALFELLNLITDTMLTQPKKITELYDRIPEGAKEQIRKRDSS